LERAVTMAKDLLKDKRILIVDDEPDVIETLKDLLSMCDLVEAYTFEDARELLERESFDMAILDIMGVDGYRLLEIANDKGVLAVMLTANALSVSHTVRSFERGAAFYVPKEEMIHIERFLKDILVAQEKGENLRDRWLERMGSFYERKFGPDWQSSDKAFWEKFNSR
jgi:DNA-binding NtrC family response regulator